MKRPLLIVTAGLLGCVGPCSGLGVSHGDLEKVVSALEHVDPEQLPVLLAAGAAEAGVGGRGCRPAMEAIAHADPAQRATLVAAGIDDCNMRCPPSLAALQPILALDPAEQTSRLVVTCGGEDPVFGGSLAGLRSGMHPMMYAMYRHIYEEIDAALGLYPGDGELWDRFLALRPALAVQLDAGWPGVNDQPYTLATAASAAPAVVGNVDMAAAARVLEERSGVLAACAVGAPAGSYRDDAGGTPGNDDVRVLFDISFGARGGAARVTVRDGNAGWEADECLVAALANAPWSGAQAGDVAMVAWPYLLVDAPEPAPEPEPSASEPSPPGLQHGGDMIRLGALDDDVVRAVVSRNLYQVRYCYQRELTKSPELSGKIVVKFVVARDGTVSSATTKSTTMHNEAVEDCINARFMRMSFPKPEGGGIVIVSYPIVFSVE